MNRIKDNNLQEMLLEGTALWSLFSGLTMSVSLEPKSDIYDWLQWCSLASPQESITAGLWNMLPSL